MGTTLLHTAGVGCKVSHRLRCLNHGCSNVTYSCCSDVKYSHRLRCSECLVFSWWVFFGNFWNFGGVRPNWGSWGLWPALYYSVSTSSFVQSSGSCFLLLPPWASCYPNSPNMMENISSNCQQKLNSSPLSCLWGIWSQEQKSY